MVVGNVRGVELRVHPLLVVVLAGAMVLGRLDELLIALLALSIHETSHALTAALFGSRILSVELMPFGGVARLTGKSFTPYAELVIASAGPITSLITAGISACSIQLFPMPVQVVRTFFSFNITLAVINLLPVLPLDGGRMLRGFLSGRAAERQITRLLSVGGIVCGMAMMGLSVWLFAKENGNLTMPVMGLFLLIAAVRELRAAPEQRLKSYIARNAEMQQGQNLPVYHIAANEHMPAREALRLMRANRYNLLRVVDAGMHLIGELDEGDLLLGMARCGTDATIGEIFSFNAKKTNRVQFDRAK